MVNLIYIFNSCNFREDPKDYFPPKPPHSPFMLLVNTSSNTPKDTWCVSRPEATFFAISKIIFSPKSKGLKNLRNPDGRGMLKGGSERLPQPLEQKVIGTGKG